MSWQVCYYLVEQGFNEGHIKSLGELVDREFFTNDFGRPRMVKIPRPETSTSTANGPTE